MADNLNKTIVVDIQVNTDGQQQIKQYKAAFETLRNTIGNLSSPLSTLAGSISSFDKDVNKLTASLDKLSNKDESTALSGKKILESFKELVETGKFLSEMFKNAGGAVAMFEAELTAGLSLLITYGPEIYKWISALFNGKEAVDKAKLSLSNMNSALDSADYSNAVKQINDLKTNVSLARKGYADKTEVLKQYNDTLGKTMGHASTLGEVEAKMVKDGGAYVKMTLLKASAQAALQDAVNMTKEIEKEKLKTDDEALTFWDKTVFQGKKALMWAKTLEGVKANYAALDKERHETAKQRIEENITDKSKQLTVDMALYKSNNEQAAEIAKKNNYDILGARENNTKAAKSQNDGLVQQQKETDKALLNSITHRLQATYSAYGSEAAAENKRFADERTNLQKLLNDKIISKQQYNTLNEKLETENRNNIATIINKYNQEDQTRTIQAQNELTQLQIKSMSDGKAKKIAELQIQQTEQAEVLDKTETESVERMKKLYADINQAKATNSNADVTELQNHLNTEINLQQVNSQKRVLLEQQTAAEIKKIYDKEAQDKLLKKDQETLDSDLKPEAKLAAEKKLITDKYQFEIDQAKGNADEIATLQTELSEKLKKLQTDFEKKRAAEQEAKRKKLKEEVLKDAKQVEENALSLITASIKQQSDAKIAALEKDKAAELGNSALTAAQKLAVEQKYKQQEGAIKTKAFKEEQEASIAQAIINGALAVTKVTAQSGVLATLEVGAVIAETAAQVAKIASQKPPAYARGGLHYTSDGRGGVLSGYSRTDNTNAYLRSGEGIVVSEAMRVPWARNLVSAINVGFGGKDFSITNPGRGYAVGGIFTDGGDANRYYNAPVTDQKNLANTIAYQMINNFPPVYVDVKDVNNQQNILAQTINRVNL